MFMFRFINPNLKEDVLDPKTGKVINFKEINVNATSEEHARKIAYRPKIDIDSDKLIPEWELVNQFPLSKDWHIKLL